MAERIVRHTTRYGNTPYPITLLLGAQDGSGAWRYWSAERTVQDRQEALDVANELLPSSYRATDSSRKLTGKSGAYPIGKSKISHLAIAPIRQFF